MPRIPENIIYTNTNIQAWQDELPGFQHTIDEQNKIINYQKELLVPLYAERQPFLDEQNRLHHDIRDKIGKIRDVEHQIYLERVRLEETARRHEEEQLRQRQGYQTTANQGYTTTQSPQQYPQPSAIDTFLHVVQDIAETKYLIDLRSDLNKYKNELSKLEDDASSYQRSIDAVNNKIAPHESIIATAKNTIARKQSAIDWNITHIQLGTDFLKALRDDPSELFKSLKDNLQTALNKYDEDYPAHQQIAVRHCLHDLVEKLITMHFKRKPPFNPQSESIYKDYTGTFVKQNQQAEELEQFNRENARLDYLRLCGFLWHLYNRVEHVEGNLANILKNLLTQTHIPENGDLPDKMQTGKQCDKYFDEHSQCHPDLFLMTDTQLEAAEKSKYEEYLKELDFFLEHPDSLAKRASRLPKTIESEIKELEKQHKKVGTNYKPDYRFYNHVTSDVIDVLSNPNDSEKAHKLGKLADHAEGVPSVGKQVGGVLLGILGVALIIGGGALAIATFIPTGGTSTIAGGFAIATGLALLESEIVLAAAYAVTAVIGSIATFFGVRKNQEGQRQGLSKDVHDIEDEALHPHVQRSRFACA